jgi:hypothetical protein
VSSRFAAWAIATWILAFFQVARAEPAETAQARAQGLFEKGVRSYEAGTFEGALDDFRKSIDLYPTPAAVKNAALCLRELGRYDEALELLEALPQRFPDLPPDEVRKNALKIDELSSQVGWVELRGVAPSSQLVVDGRERGAVPPGSRVRMSGGLHRLRVTKEGMEPVDVSVSTVSGQTVVADVDQRPSVAPYPSSWILGVELGGALTSTLGGDVAGCSSPCGRSVGGGARAIAHVGHALGSRLFFAIDAGYLTVGQNVDQRSGDLVVLGGPTTNTGLSSDDLSLHGGVLGASLGYRLPSLGDSFVRAGAGSFFGWVSDERDGNFNTTSSLPYHVAQTQRQPAVYGYASAAIGFGFRATPHVRLGAGIDAMAMVAFRQPKWDGQCAECSVLGRDGESQFRSQEMTGRFIMLVSPFVEASYLF